MKMNRSLKIVIITLVVILGLFALGSVIVRIGLTGARGDFSDVLKGQSDPEPQLTQKDISSVGNSSGEVYSVTLAVDEQPMGLVDDEYVSFSIDSSQLVGGKWWNPTASGKEGGSGTTKSPAFDFNRPQLNTLVAALAPAYLRIGGSEADKIYYDMENATPNAIPNGYDSALGTDQWDAANAFAQRNNLKMIFTLNAGPASRNSSGAWDPENAESLLKYSAEKEYPIAGWELGNEVNIYWFVHGLNKQVSPDQYASDMKTAHDLVGNYYPNALFSGQGSAYWPILGEPLKYYFGFMPTYLEKAGNLTDIVSWHYYPQQSRRGPIATRRATPSRMLDPNNLNDVAYWASEIRTLKTKYARGANIWVGETGNAQFGGEPGVSDAYIGGLWWLDELGLLARYDTKVVVRQSLTGMNYGLIDEETLVPRPDYWNTLLWKNLMGNEIYKTTLRGDNSDKLRVYAHSVKGERSGVSILIINLDPEKSASVSLPNYPAKPFEIYALSSPDLFGQTLYLNGKELALTDQGELPVLYGLPVLGSGVPEITLNPLSYMFLVFRPMIAASLVP